MAKILCVIMNGLQLDALKSAHTRYLKRLLSTGLIPDNIKPDRNISFVDLAPSIAYLLKIEPHSCRITGNAVQKICTPAESTATTAHDDHHRIHLLQMEKIPSAA